MFRYILGRILCFALQIFNNKIKIKIASHVSAFHFSLSLYQYSLSQLKLEDVAKEICINGNKVAYISKESKFDKDGV